MVMQVPLKKHQVRQLAEQVVESVQVAGRGGGVTAQSDWGTQLLVGKGAGSSSPRRVVQRHKHHQLS